jgi:uncharacterized FlgJ-related protein
MKLNKMKVIIVTLLLIISTNISVGSTRIARTQQIDSVTVSKLITSVCSLPFKYKKIIVAQGILETGWFQSKNFKTNNNLFGMKPPKNRITTSDSSINGYAHYQKWQLSVIDYYLLLAVRNDVQHIKSEVEYYKFVDQIYSEMGHSYSDQLKAIVSQLNLDQLDPKITTYKRSSKNRKKKHR